MKIWLAFIQIYFYRDIKFKHAIQKLPEKYKIKIYFRTKYFTSHILFGRNYITYKR